MPRSPVQKYFIAILFTLIAPISLSAEQFKIYDKEGLEKSMIAYVAAVGDGWTSQGRIAWSKPCSSNDLYETLFVTRSRNGANGARIMPGYQFFQEPHSLPPDIRLTRC